MTTTVWLDPNLHLLGPSLTIPTPPTLTAKQLKQKVDAACAEKDPLAATDTTILVRLPSSHTTSPHWDPQLLTYLTNKDEILDLTLLDNDDSTTVLGLTLSPQLYLSSAGGIAVEDSIPADHPDAAFLTSTLSFAHSLYGKAMVDHPDMAPPALLLSSRHPPETAQATLDALMDDLGFHSPDPQHNAQHMTRARTRVFHELSFIALALAPYIHLHGHPITPPSDPSDPSDTTSSTTNPDDAGPSSSSSAIFKQATSTPYTLTYTPSPHSPYSACSRLTLTLRLTNYPLLPPSLHFEHDDPPPHHLHILPTLSAVTPSAPARTGRVDLAMLRPDRWTPLSSVAAAVTTLVILLEGLPTCPDPIVDASPFPISHSASMSHTYRNDRAAYWASVSDSASTLSTLSILSDSATASDSASTASTPSAAILPFPTSFTPPEQHIETALALKSLGSSSLQSNDLPTAIRLYTYGIAHAHPHAHPESSTTLHALYLNRSLAHTKSKSFAAAASDATTIITLLTTPSTPSTTSPLAKTLAKAYFRRARASTGLQNYDDAIADLQQATTLQPTDTSLTRELDRVTRAKASANRSEAAMARRMFG